MRKNLSQPQIIERNNKIREYLINNPEKLQNDYSETAKQFKVSKETVRHICRSLRDKLKQVDVSVLASKDKEAIEEEIEFKISEEVLVRKENAEIKSLKRQIEQAVKDYEILSEAYDIALNLKTQDVSGVTIPTIHEDKDHSSEAAAIIQISDGHFAKIIEPSTVNYLNEYNPEIARERMTITAENSLKLIYKERHDVKLDNLVLILGGDFLENSQLHEGSQMTTAMSPMEETLFARELLTGYIKTVAEYGNFKKIMIICNRGNHPRITKKMSAAIDYKMNYEYILYNVLKSDFTDSLFEWYIPDSEIAEFNVFGYTLRSIHGHSIKYNGGIGGVSIPLNKYIMKMDNNRPADYTFLHHFHNLSYPTNRSTINGSVVGYDPFAMQIGASAEPPMQAFQLLDKRKGFTIKAPIFCS